MQLRFWFTIFRIFGRVAWGILALVGGVMRRMMRSTRGFWRLMVVVLRTVVVLAGLDRVIEGEGGITGMMKHPIYLQEPAVTTAAAAAAAVTEVEVVGAVVTTEIEGTKKEVVAIGGRQDPRVVQETGVKMTMAKAAVATKAEAEADVADVGAAEVEVAMTAGDRDQRSLHGRGMMITRA